MFPVFIYCLFGFIIMELLTIASFLVYRKIDSMGWRNDVEDFAEFLAIFHTIVFGIATLIMFIATLVNVGNWLEKAA